MKTVQSAMVIQVRVLALSWESFFPGLFCLGRQEPPR